MITKMLTFASPFWNLPRGHFRGQIPFANLSQSTLKVHVYPWPWVDGLEILIGYIRFLSVCATLLLFQLLPSISCFPLLIYEQWSCTYICSCILIVSYCNTFSDLLASFSIVAWPGCWCSPIECYDIVGNDTAIMITPYGWAWMINAILSCFPVISTYYRWISIYVCTDWLSGN